MPPIRGRLGTPDGSERHVALDEHPFPGGVAMTKDPVCGMAVDEKTAAATASYEGRTYHFCSAACKSKFEKEPRKYAERAGKP